MKVTVADLRTPSDVAERLGLARLTALRYMRWGRLPALKIGRELFMDATDLERIATERAALTK